MAEIRLSFNWSDIGLAIIFFRLSHNTGGYSMTVAFIHISLPNCSVFEKKILLFSVWKVLMTSINCKKNC